MPPQHVVSAQNRELICMHWRMDNVPKQAFEISQKALFSWYFVIKENLSLVGACLDG